MSMNYGYGPNIIQYTLQAGDSLWNLASQYNTTPEYIIAANPGINPNTTYVGQIIYIPTNQLPVSAEQFRRFGRGFRPRFRRPFFRRRFPFRRFRRPFFMEPFEFEEFEEFEEPFEFEEFEEFEEPFF